MYTESGLRRPNGVQAAFCISFLLFKVNIFALVVGEYPPVGGGPVACVYYRLARGSVRRSAPAARCSAAPASVGLGVRLPAGGFVGRLSEHPYALVEQIGTYGDGYDHREQQEQEQY